MKWKFNFIQQIQNRRPPYDLLKQKAILYPSLLLIFITFFIAFSTSRIFHTNHVADAATATSPLYFTTLPYQFQPVYFKGGYYGLNHDTYNGTDEVQRLANAEMTLALLPYYLPTSPMHQKLQANNVKYFDVTLSSYIYKYCSPYMNGSFDKFSAGVCPLQNYTSTIMASVSAHLEAVKNDPAIVGFHVLDDPPYSDFTVTKQLLEQEHSLIAQYNITRKAQGLPQWSTDCLEGGYLDQFVNGAPTPKRDNDQYMNFLAKYFTPKGCDFINVEEFAQGLTNDPTLFDWSMTSVLDRLKTQLLAQGWDADKNPMIGNSQVFFYSPFTQNVNDYVQPRAQDITTQAEAFCQQGAVSFLSYSGDDTAYSLASGRYTSVTELFNSDTYLSALQQGVDYCKANAWNLGIANLGLPLGAWNFNETSGNIAHNSSAQSSAMDATMYYFGTPPASGWDPTNGAFLFNGSYTYGGLNLPTILTKSNTTTLSAWINTPHAQTQMIVAAEPRGSNAYGKGFDLFVSSNGKGEIRKGNGSGWTYTYGNTTISDGKWHHVEATFDGYTMKLYIDGTLDASTADSTPIDWTDATAGNPYPAQFYFGMYKDNSLGLGATVPHQYPFWGEMKNVKVYNYDRSADQVTTD